MASSQDSETTVELTFSQTDDLSDASFIYNEQTHDRASLNRRLFCGYPGSRRHRRWMNQNFLLKQKIPGRSDDVNSAGGVFETGAQADESRFDSFLNLHRAEPLVENRQSPLSILLNDPQLLNTWQDFIDITEELQAQLMKSMKIW